MKLGIKFILLTQTHSPHLSIQVDLSTMENGVVLVGQVDGKDPGVVSEENAELIIQLTH
jgi:hypothetical protein